MPVLSMLLHVMLKMFLDVMLLRVSIASTCNSENIKETHGGLRDTVAPQTSQTRLPLWRDETFIENITEWNLVAPHLRIEAMSCAQELR